MAQRKPTLAIGLANDGFVPAAAYLFYKLDELFAGMKPVTFHDIVDFGSPVSEELGLLLKSHPTYR